MFEITFETEAGKKEDEAPTSWLVQGPHRFQVFVTDLFRTLDEAMRLTPATTRATFLKEAGLVVPDGMPDEKVAFVFKSFLQSAWYRFVKGEVPTAVQLNHDKRLADFAARVDRFREQPDERRSPKPLPELPVAPTEMTLGMVDNVPSVVLSSLDGTLSTPIFLVRPHGLSATIEALRKRADSALCRAILIAAGYEAPEGFEVNVYYPVAAGIVRAWWYRFAATHGLVNPAGEPVTEPIIWPDDLAFEQQRRYNRYRRAIQFGVTAKQPDVEKPEKLRLRRAKSLTFNLVKGAPVDHLRGQTKQVYEAVLAVTSDASTGGAPLDAVVARAVAAGFVTGEKAGATLRIRWLALELVKKGILYVLDEQLEIPGTPAPLVSR